MITFWVNYCEKVILTLFKFSSLTELIDWLDKLFHHEVKEFSLDGSSTLFHVSLETIGCPGYSAISWVNRKSILKTLRWVSWFLFTFHVKKILPAQFIDSFFGGDDVWCLRSLSQGFHLFHTFVNLLQMTVGSLLVSITGSISSSLGIGWPNHEKETDNCEDDVLPHDYKEWWLRVMIFPVDQSQVMAMVMEVMARDCEENQENKEQIQDESRGSHNRN